MLSGANEIPNNPNSEQEFPVPGTDKDFKTLDSAWSFGAPRVEWQVTCGEGEVHIFYSTVKVKEFLRTADFFSRWDETAGVAQFCLTIRKVTRHDEQSILINTEFRAVPSQVGLEALSVSELKSDKKSENKK
jgi:hypothetical protein